MHFYRTNFFIKKKNYYVNIKFVLDNHPMVKVCLSFDLHDQDEISKLFSSWVES